MAAALVQIHAGAPDPMKILVETGFNLLKLGLVPFGSADT